MSKFKSFAILAGAAALGIALGAAPVSAAAVYTITTDNIGVDCSAGCGTVTVTDAGLSSDNFYTFDIDLTSALYLHSVGNGNTRVFGANLAGVTGIDSGPVDALLQPSGNFDGYGSFSFGVFCTNTQTIGANSNICDPNGQSASSDDLVFSVFAPTGETLTNNSAGVPLALDVADASNTSNTGFATVPAPLVGHGLLVLLAVGGVLSAGKLLENFKKRSLHTA